MSRQIRAKNQMYSSMPQRAGFCSISLWTAMSVQLLCPMAQAADFGKASQLYVPPSAYDRRVDFSSIREQYAVPSKIKQTLRAPAKTHASAAPKAASKAAVTTPKVSSIERASVKAPPPPALPGRANSTQSFAEMARHLSSKVPAGTVGKMKQTAQDLVKSGKLDEAQRVLGKINQLTPTDKENLKQIGSVSLMRAKQYLKSDNYSEAIVAARQALAVDPANTEAGAIVSQVYKKAGADPNDVTHRLRTADSLYSQGRYHEAEVEYKASMGVKPTPEAHVGLGKVSEKIHGSGTGKKHFEHALELDSNSALAHRELGVAHLDKGDVVSANSALSRAVILNPADKEAGKHLVKLWQTQVSKVPNANSHLGLARAYQLTGDLQAAQSEYREVVRLDPNHAYLPAARQSFKSALAKQESEKSYIAAKTLESQGLLSDAYQKAQEASNYNAGNSAYKIYQGELLERMGQTAQARTAYMNVLKDDPNNVSAAQKIKNLPSADAIGTAAGIAGLAGLGGFMPSSHPAGFPGSKFPFPTAPASSGVPMIDPATGMATGQVDQVGSLSNFIGQIRNHALLQKTQNEKIEDAAHKVIKSLTNPEPAGGGIASMASAAAGAAGGAEPTAADEDFLNKILNSPVGSALPSKGGSLAAPSAAAASAATPTVAPVSAPSTVSSASKKASAVSKAASAAKTATTQHANHALQAMTPHYGTMTESAAPPTAPSFKGTSAPATAQYQAPSSMPFQSAPVSAPVTAPLAQQYQTPSFLAPNAQLPETPSFLAPSAPTFGAPAQAQYQAPTFSSPAQAPVFAAPQAQYAQPSLASPQTYSAPSFNVPVNAPDSSPSFFAPQAPATAPSTAGYFAPDSLQGTAPALPASKGNNSHHALRGPLTSNALRFELKQIKPTMTNVQLRVTLRNDGDQALSIPDNLQAIIRYPDMHESEVKIAFDSKSVASHGSLDGTVKVPFDKVDPTADLVLRNISSQELHLITSVVQRPQ